MSLLDWLCRKVRRAASRPIEEGAGRERADETPPPAAVGPGPEEILLGVALEHEDSEARCAAVAQLEDPRHVGEALLAARSGQEAARMVETIGRERALHALVAQFRGVRYSVGHAAHKMLQRIDEDWLSTAAVEAAPGGVLYFMVLWDRVRGRPELIDELARSTGDPDAVHAIAEMLERPGRDPTPIRQALVSLLTHKPDLFTEEDLRALSSKHTVSYKTSQSYDAGGSLFTSSRRHVASVEDVQAMARRVLRDRGVDDLPTE